jgi:hypothetical protein
MVNLLILVILSIILLLLIVKKINVDFIMEKNGKISLIYEC